MFTLQTSFKPLLLGGGGGIVKSVVEMTVNSKEENSEDFCTNYNQEFGLWINIFPLYPVYDIQASSSPLYPFSVSSPVSQLNLAFCIPASSNPQYLSFTQVSVSTFHPCFFPAVGSFSLIQLPASLSHYLFLILSPLRLILFILPFIRTLYPAHLIFSIPHFIQLFVLGIAL